jgi:hypothetical protein
VENEFTAFFRLYRGKHPAEADAGERELKDMIDTFFEQLHEKIKDYHEVGAEDTDAKAGVWGYVEAQVKQIYSHSMFDENRDIDFRNSLVPS